MLCGEGYEVYKRPLEQVITINMYADVYSHIFFRSPIKRRTWVKVANAFFLAWHTCINALNSTLSAVGRPIEYMPSDWSRLKE